MGSEPSGNFQRINRAMMQEGQVRTTILQGFDDPRLGSARWAELLQRGSTDTVNLTWLWQKTWWDAFAKGELLLMAAERDGNLVALAPWFAADGMVINLCPEDHLDFVGDVSDPAVLDALLETARSHLTHFVGFRFYFIPSSSSTGEYLRQAAGRLQMTCFEEASLAAPYLDLKADMEHARKCTRKESLRRHERFFVESGGLNVQHSTAAEDILPHLDEFFQQHVGRRAVTAFPSLFADNRQREYYRQLTRRMGPTGWLRFTRLEWHGRNIAFHYGLSYRGRYLWGIPSFAIDLAKHSPGEVLLRQSLLAAMSEGAHTFDFGPGDESYKYRFTNRVVQLQTLGLYPTS